MSAKYIASVLFVLGVAGTDIGAAEMARLPAGVAAIAPYEFGHKSGVSSAFPRDVIEHVIGADGSPLAENSWDFTKPETIPGFGTLPPSYGAGSMLLPRFSGSE